MAGTRYSAGEIYADMIARPRVFIQEIPPAIPSGFNISIEPDKTGSDIDRLSAAITSLREQDFDGYYIDRDNTRVLVKYNDTEKNRKPFKLNPIHLHEAEVQALRYIRGMLLIASNMHDLKAREKHLLAVRQIYNDYQSKKDQAGSASADLTHWLAEQCANSIARNLEVKPEDGRRQLTMARDLGILMENHPAVCTISEDNKSVSVQQSRLGRISQEYYNDRELFDDVTNKPWCKSANRLAGFSAEQSPSWIDLFFTRNLGKLKELGVPAPPSARWLPIPANYQIAGIDVAAKTKNGVSAFTHTEYVRTGVAASYDIRKTPDNVNSQAEQKKIAKKILMEIIMQQLEVKVGEFKRRYAHAIGDGECNFYVNYQTLLSPIIGELRFSHIDNNAKFVDMMKAVMLEITRDQNLIYRFRDEHRVNLKFCHTNAAVNRHAFLSNEFSADDRTRNEKIDETLAICAKYSDADRETLSHDLRSEIERREKAARCLRSLLDNENPYSGLSRYQRNIMMAALEYISMGSQGHTLAGCKSGRDRTGVFDCAVKTMLENPRSMRNWNALESGIVKSLKQGHAFRSMIFHSAIVKISLVHARFMKKLQARTQSAIKSLLKFSIKTTPYYEKRKPVRTRMAAKARTTPEKFPVTNASTSRTISKEEAASLLLQVTPEYASRRIRTGMDTWESRLHNFHGISKFSRIADLDKFLAETREDHLNARSYLYDTSQGTRVRIFPPKTANLETDARDLFASGIDCARGALAIIDNSAIERGKAENAVRAVRNMLLTFHHNIQALRTDREDSQAVKLEKLQKARIEYRKFYGALSSILVEYGCYADPKLAANGILEARDLLWTLSRRDEAVCTVRNADSGTAALSFARRIYFPGTDMTDYTQQPWYLEIESKHPWANSFIRNNQELLHLSGTPMQRSMPNPANAWDEATILVKGGQVQQVISGVRMGISSPYQVRDREERQRLANRSHLLMATDSRLLQYAGSHIQAWKQLLNQDEIVIPILHQTLIDPGSLIHIANRSGSNPRDMIWRKTIANRELREYLDEKEFFYDPKNDQIRVNPESTDGLIKIRFAVKETNNGVNIHEKMTDRTRRDIRDSEDLIFMVKEKLRLCKFKTSDTAISNDIDIVITYLSSSTPERNPRPMNENEKQAMDRLCRILCKGKLEHLDLPTQRNLALLTQAAVNLASFLTRHTDTSFLGFVRDGMAFFHSSLKPADLNDATYKSCYERIIAELLGVRMGGCKSALDREQEVAELTNAMYRQFQAEGKICNYHDSEADKEAFRRNYVNTQHKHNMCEMITGNPGSADIETQGQAYHLEAPYEQKVSALLMSSCRHPGYVDFHHSLYTHTHPNQEAVSIFRSRAAGLEPENPVPASGPAQGNKSS